MSEIFALYNVLSTYQQSHIRTLELAESLTDQQIVWRPEGYSNSIGFHLWHLARWTDVLQARIASRFPDRQAEFGNGVEIWETDNLAERWGFPVELGSSNAGTGLGDDETENLPIPNKSELIDYARRTFEAIEKTVAVLDEQYPSFDHLDEPVKANLQWARNKVIYWVAHDSRHLGMMETLKGLQTGKGSAAA